MTTEKTVAKCVNHIDNDNEENSGINDDGTAEDGGGAGGDNESRGQLGVTTLDNELCTLLAKITAAAGIENNFAALILHYGEVHKSQSS